MASRSEDGTTWTQDFDEEERLEEISDGADTWGFVYDGDGVRVKQENPDGTTTLFLSGGSYEVHIDGETTTVKKYYAAGGQRVMRDSDGLHYLLADHLGSVVGVLDGNGSLETNERYLPFGGLRDTSGITETDFAFTGQRNLSDVGLMDYNARWYSPSIGRFISPDTIVPEPGNPQALNRYAYVANNPLRYTDPSGHLCFEVGTKVICSADDDSYGYWLPSRTPPPPSHDECVTPANCLDRMDAWLTYSKVVKMLGGEPDISDVLYMTAGSEYWAYVDHSFTPDSKTYNPRKVGQEALARNFYEACGKYGCTHDELYAFLAGFQPWIGAPGVIDGSPSKRADKLINNLDNEFYNTGHLLREDIEEILGDKARKLRWITGKKANRPWQWYGGFVPGRPGDFGLHANDAILSIDLGGGNEFWMFTGLQDDRFTPP